MAGAVDVRVVSVLGLVFDCGGVDGDTARAFLWCGVNLVVLLGDGVAVGGQGHGERGGEGGLAMVHVTDCSNVHVGFLSLEFPPCRPYCEGAAVVD